MTIRISVIIPALNEAAKIENTLTDLAPVRKAGHEVIVVDGGSNDDTVAVAEPYCDVIIHTPPGRAKQMNAGANVAKGELLWFLHADCRVPLETGKMLLTELVDGCQWGRFDVRLSGNQLPLRMIEQLMNLRSRITGIATGDQGIFVARQAFDAVGHYPDIPLMEDIALSKALRSRIRPVCIDRKLVPSSRRWEDKGIWRTIFLMWRLRLSYALGTSPESLAKHYR